MDTDEYARLLLSCDLLLTENAVSSSLGKAVCGGIPCALLKNSYRLPEVLERVQHDLRRIVLDMERARLGAVFPYEVFPIWGRDDIEQLGLFRENSVTAAFAAVEVFGGDAMREQLRALLVDERTRHELRAAQRRYVDGLLGLDDAYAALCAATTAPA
jgi:hypothetical protein